MFKSTSEDEKKYGKIVHSGILKKKSRGKSWIGRFAVLWQDGSIRFYESEQIEKSSHGKIIGKIKLKHVNKITKLPDTAGKQPHRFGVWSTSLKKQWQFATDNDESTDEWVRMINSTIIVRKRASDAAKNAQTEAIQFRPKPGANVNPQSNRNAHPNGTDENDDDDAANQNATDLSIASTSTTMGDMSAVSSRYSVSGPSSMMGGDMDEFNEEKFQEELRAMEMRSRDSEEQVSSPGNDGAGASGGAAARRSISGESKEREISIELSEVSRLRREKEEVVMHGNLERKTNQKVFGKRLWEPRFFKLSTHALTVYRNEQSHYPESIWKLSSLVAVNVCSHKTAGNRFDIRIQNEPTHSPTSQRITADTVSVELRTNPPNSELCQQWVSIISEQRRKHRRSIRSGLENVAKYQIAHHKHDDDEPSVEESSEDEHSQDRTDSIPTHQNKRPKSTSRAEKNMALAAKLASQQKQGYQRPKGPPVSGGKKKKGGRRLSLRSWAVGVENLTLEPSLSTRSVTFDSENPKKTLIRPQLTKPVNYCGYLVVRRLVSAENDDDNNPSNAGNDTTSALSDVIGESLYFELNEDTLVYKQHDTDTTILGSISVDHMRDVIKSPNATSEFTIVFSEGGRQDWQVSVPTNSLASAEKWVAILRRARKEAQAIQQTIMNELAAGEDNVRAAINESHHTLNRDNPNSNTADSNNPINTIAEKDESPIDDNGDTTTTTTGDTEKEMRSIKALADCILTETLQEVELEPHEMDHDDGFDLKLEPVVSSDNNAAEAGGVTVTNNQCCVIL